jgi:dTDP-4-amino-4,6-dideoxygalactose transaminase
MKPILPLADKILPYLKRIDEARYYSNFGELNAEYQNRLGELFGAPVVTGSSATSLITATLMSYDFPKGSTIAMPSWTFPATAAAVVSAGYVPYFMDVVSHTGILNNHTWPAKVKAMIVVAPLGAPVPIGYWDDFATEFKTPVVIDAAAGFDTFSTLRQPGNNPVVISTHATKVFGTGEGGFVSCHDTALLEKVRRITNFGLSPDRSIEYSGLNAKFDEYHAAIGLAELDGWPEKRHRYLEATAEHGLDYAVAQVGVMGGKEGRKGVYGCHIHKAYGIYPRTEMPVTDDLIENTRFVTVGLP